MLIDGADEKQRRKTDAQLEAPTSRSDPSRRARIRRAEMVLAQG